MQFTIISDKLPHLSVEEFKHEFQVHAAETQKTASSLGLITRYTQGLYLPSAIDGATQLTGLPLPEHKGPYQSLAQLTWPSVEVLQGSLQSAGYRASAAGKHEFAVPKHLFFTERLDTDQGKRHLDGLGGLENNPDVGDKLRPVMLIAALTPKAGIDDAEFNKLWAKHANGVRTMSNTVYYCRNAVIPMSSEQVRAVVAGTQFPAERCCSTGGYEEFLFGSIKDAQSFCDQHGEALRLSYGAFCDMEGSWCAGFDYNEFWGQADIGLQQQIVGTVLGLFLSVKAQLRL